jgi:hypothetical protein
MRNNLIILLNLLASFGFLYGQTQPIPEGKLAYPILVDVPTRIPASGFFLSDGGHIYFVTARHVIFDTTDQLWATRVTVTAYSGISNDTGSSVLAVDLDKLNNLGFVLRHPVADVAAVRIGDMVPVDGKTGCKFNAGIRVVRLNPKGISPIARENTKAFDDVQVANEVIVIGYPSAIGLQDIPSQFDHRHPLLRKGIVAGKNASLSTLILDCPIYYGNSGSPVIEIERSFAVDVFKVVGVATEFVPFDERWVNRVFGLSSPLLTNSGYSVAVPTDRIFEIIGK